MTLVQQTLPEKLMEETENRHPPTDLPEVRIMLRIITGISWLNLLIGLPSVILVLNLKSLSLVATGLLSILTFRLLRMVVRHINQATRWTEVGVLIMCGIYLPAFIVWIGLNSLIDAILR